MPGAADEGWMDNLSPWTMKRFWSVFIILRDKTIQPNKLMSYFNFWVRNNMDQEKDPNSRGFLGTWNVVFASVGTWNLLTEDKCGVEYI